MRKAPPTSFFYMPLLVWLALGLDVHAQLTFPSSYHRDKIPGSYTDTAGHTVTGYIQFVYGIGPFDHLDESRIQVVDSLDRATTVSTATIVELSCTFAGAETRHYRNISIGETKVFKMQLTGGWHLQIYQLIPRKNVFERDHRCQ